MGVRKRVAALLLAFGGLVVVTACEPSPPPPTTPPKTPEGLISKAEFEVITKGMALADVEWALRKQLTLDEENVWNGIPGRPFVARHYSHTSMYGDCWQRATFSFTNLDDKFEVRPGELLLSSKFVDEYQCEGIVK